MFSRMSWACGKVNPLGLSTSDIFILDGSRKPCGFFWFTFGFKMCSRVKLSLLPKTRKISAR